MTIAYSIVTLKTPIAAQLRPRTTEILDLVMCPVFYENMFFFLGPVFFFLQLFEAQIVLEMFFFLQPPAISISRFFSISVSF